jgi:hypothetical protein
MLSALPLQESYWVAQIRAIIGPERNKHMKQVLKPLDISGECDWPERYKALFNAAYKFGSYAKAAKKNNTSEYMEMYWQEFEEFERFMDHVENWLKAQAI